VWGMGNRPTPLKVLLVEDNPGDARMVRELLHQVGPIPIELQHVERLAQAIRYMREDGFNAIVLDLCLPDSQGLQTFTLAYTPAPRAPIVVLTGLRDEEIAMRAVREGAQDYLIKGQVDGALLYHSIRYSIERHRAEIGLRASEARLRSIIDAAPDAVMTMDVAGIVRSWNAQAERLFGWTAVDIVGRPLADVLLSPRTHDAWERALSRTANPQPTKVVALQRDGRELPIELQVAPLDAEGASLFGVFARPARERRAEVVYPLKKLTPRQRDVLQLIAEGHSTRESARRLGVSVKTVEAHRAQLMKRLGILSVAGLVRYAARVGLIELEP
jgi:PAS domain S-box-containing protein